MRRIAWSPKSLRAFKRMVRQTTQLRPLIEETLEQLAEDPFHPTLKTHKLAGEFAGIWACSIDYRYRILFEFVANPNESEDAILLVNLGDHDDIYEMFISDRPFPRVDRFLLSETSDRSWKGDRDGKVEEANRLNCRQ